MSVVVDEEKAGPSVEVSGRHGFRREDSSASKHGITIDQKSPVQLSEPQPSNVIPKGPSKPDGEAYSVFTTKQKKLIILSGSVAGLLSPLTGSIYYPAISTIANDLNVSASKINLTVTTYLIVQGLAPMMIAGFSDNCGRRPAFMVCLVIYIIANIALGLQDNYYALLILRMLQSGGSSGTIALAQGVVGDVITSSERGKYIAFSSITGILGPMMSPILGGVLSTYLGWHSVFWFLLIFSTSLFILIILFHPETCRAVVGDGSIPPPPLNNNLTDNRRHAARLAANIPIDEAKQSALRANYSLSFPNPLHTLIVFTDPCSLIILLACGFNFANFYAISTGASAAFKSLYGFSDLYVSLMFIPFGAGGVISAFTTGRMVDWNYARHARRLNFPIVKNRQVDLTNFPIERARLEIGLPLMWLGALGVLGYGWLMDHKVSLAGPVVLLILIGYGLSASFQVLNVLMIDMYPGKPATVTAANNITRCELGAAATAAIGPMIDAMGSGGAYTLLSGLFMGFSPMLLLVMVKGQGWRKAKKERLERKKQKELEEVGIEMETKK